MKPGYTAPTNFQRNVAICALLTLLLGEKVSQLVPDVMSFSTSHETASL